MRRLFGFIVFLAIVIIAIALWRGWITIFVNQPKIDHDTHKVERTLEHGANKIEHDVHTGAKKVEQNTDGSPAPAPAP